jgi:hypothetical protein
MRRLVISAAIALAVFSCTYNSSKETSSEDSNYLKNDIENKGTDTLQPDTTNAGGRNNGSGRTKDTTGVGGQ